MIATLAFWIVDVWQIMELFDGISVKSREVMVVMTSNRAAEMHKGMLRAGRIDAAIEEGEQIAIWGDYDADGMTAIVVWVTALRRLPYAGKTVVFSSELAAHVNDAYLSLGVDRIRGVFDYEKQDEIANTQTVRVWLERRPGG